jgi:hypothetical protein
MDWLNPGAVFALEICYSKKEISDAEFRGEFNLEGKEILRGEGGEGNVERTREGGRKTYEPT